MSGHMEEAGNNPPAPGMHVSNSFYAIRDPLILCAYSFHTSLKPRQQAA